MSTVVRRALYGKMAGDGTLTGLLASPPSGFTKSIYFELAPEGAPYPFVVFSKQASTPRYALKQRAYDNEIWLVKGVDKATSADGADAISARLDVLLTDGAISISGRTELYLRRESDTEYSEVIDGERIIHSGSSYRLIFE